MDTRSPQPPRRTARHDRRRRAGRRLTAVAVAAGCALAAVLASHEVQTSQVQAGLFAEQARRLTYHLADGANPQALYPEHGPYDARAGYVTLPETLRRLETQGYTIRRQARLSPVMARQLALGGIAVYPEKEGLGLDLSDRAGRPIHAHRTPARTFDRFGAIPALVVDTLLFIENRELMSGPATHNPAIEWDRLAAAALHQLSPIPIGGLTGGGGSTLATQMEKFRHSPGGRTSDPAEKLRQLFAASLRAYADGPDTRATRQRIVRSYLNATPLAGRAGFGEVIGLPEGLAVWFGLDVADVSALLEAHRACQGGSRTDCPPVAAVARAYKPVLALLLAQRRPSHFLGDGFADLRALVDRHIGALTTAGVLDGPLAAAVRASPLELAHSLPARPIPPKTAQTVRTDLATLIGADDLYNLDRLDLQARSTIDLEVQTEVAAILGALAHPSVAEAHRLVGPSLLGANPERVIYALRLMERTAAGNVVRIDVDSLLGQPFSVGDGAKLDLGSTAKLRTLVTYLQLVEEAGTRIAGRPVAELRSLATDAPDGLTRWVAATLAADPAGTTDDLLQAALDRRWSASPAERFMTGGGLHRFANFDRRDDARRVSLAEAFRTSINLPFIRLMRETSEHLRQQVIPEAAAILADASHPARARYLHAFARSEGTLFLSRFYARFAGLEGEALASALAQTAPRRATGYAALYRSLYPAATPAEVHAFVARELARHGNPPAADGPERLFDRGDVTRFGLNDRAYLSGTHPLALWLAGYLQTAPAADWTTVRAAADDVLLESYAWLFKPGRKSGQDSRIRTVMERAVFEEVHRKWAAVGYPFDALVPSLATAIGASADRPSALAELMGILSNDGLRLPTVRFSQLRFAADTPFEAELVPTTPEPVRVLSPRVAAAVRGALGEVVSAGTARRIDGAFVDAAGRPVPIAGKTGTGDSRHETVTRTGAVVSSRVLARTATFAFLLGDRHFGVITAYVPGAEAEQQHFTSALPTQLLRVLAPTLRPLLDDPPTRAPVAALLPAAVQQVSATQAEGVGKPTTSAAR